MFIEIHDWVCSLWVAVKFSEDDEIAKSNRVWAVILFLELFISFHLWACSILANALSSCSFLLLVFCQQTLILWQNPSRRSNLFCGGTESLHHVLGSMLLPTIGTHGVIRRSFDKCVKPQKQ